MGSNHEFNKYISINAEMRFNCWNNPSYKLDLF